MKIKILSLPVRPFAIICLAGSFIISCNNNSTSNGTSSQDSAQKQNKATFQNSKDDKNTAQFVVDAANANYDEIGLSEFAEKHTVNREIKDFAHMMVMDHTDALGKLKDAAQKQNISVPSNDSANINSITKGWESKTPSEFNSVYVDKMVKDHKDVLNALEKNDTTINNADIKGWIDAVIPKVKEHLQKITEIQDKMKKKDS